MKSLIIRNNIFLQSPWRSVSIRNYPFHISSNYRWSSGLSSPKNSPRLGNRFSVRFIHNSHILMDKPNEIHNHSHDHQPSHDHQTSHKQDLPLDHTHSHSDHDSHSHDSHSHEHSHSGMALLGHSHSHSQPNELLSSSLSNPAVRITWIGLVTNIVLAASKGVGGIYFHSQSLIADALHSLSDLVADFLTLATVNVAAKIGTPDKFPLGYGKIESAGALFVSGVLLFAGISVGWSSLLQVFEYTLPSYMYELVSKVQIGHSHSHAIDLSDTHDHGHSHSHLESPVDLKPVIPNINAAWLAAGSIGIKELLYQKTMKVAHQTNSKVLVANAWHHRVDSLTALVATVTVTGGNLFNVAWLDSVGGLLVSFLIIKAGWGSFKSAWYELIDRGENKLTDVSYKIQLIVKKLLVGAEFKVLDLSILTSGANSNIFLTLVGSKAKNQSSNEINDLQEKIVRSIKDQDKFIRNVFVQFKKVDQDKYQSLTDEDINKSS